VENFASIMAAARAGAEWAWTAIYRDLSPSLLGYLRGQSSAEAEDLTGEVFLQVVRDLPRFEGDERAFRAWVFTIAHHRLLDHRRYSSRRPVAPAPKELIESLARPADAEEEQLHKLSVARAREVIGKLSPDQRNVLLLRVLGGLTIEEVARVIDKRPGAVKALQRRGLATLKREMSKEAISL
jgi:RNA polymerase sigma-70 factor (ECF subfamily)